MTAKTAARAEAAFEITVEPVDAEINSGSVTELSALLFRRIFEARINQFIEYPRIPAGIIQKHLIPCEYPIPTIPRSTNPLSVEAEVERIEDQGEGIDFEMDALVLDEPEGPKPADEGGGKELIDLDEFELELEPDSPDKKTS